MIIFQYCLLYINKLIPFLLDNMRRPNTVDIPRYIGYPHRRPGGSGAAEPCETRQVRKEAAVRRSLRVPPVLLPGHFLFPMPLSNKNISSIISV
jgi:hypothetical protein